MEYLCVNPDCMQVMQSNTDWLHLVKQQQILHCPACNLPLVSRSEYDKLKEKIRRDAENGEDRIEQAMSSYETVSEKWRKGIIETVADYLRAFFDLMRDPKAAITNKVIAALAILYLVSPLDVIPDFLPVIGYVDDYLFIMAAVALLGAGLHAYMTAPHMKATVAWQSKSLLIDRFDIGPSVGDTDNYYYEDKHLRCWRVSDKALERSCYQPIGNQLFRRNETFMLHPILKNTLIGFEQFNAYILEQKRRELQLLFSGLGAMEAEYTHYVEKGKTAATRLDLSLLHKFVGSGQMSASDKNHTFDMMSETRKQSGNVDGSLAFLDELIWLFEDPNAIQDYCYRRIVNGEFELRQEFVHSSEQYFSAEAKVSVKKAGVNVKSHFALSVSEAVKTVSIIRYAPLQLPDGETKEGFYARVMDKIGERMNALRG